MVEVKVTSPVMESSKNLSLSFQYRKNHFPILVEWKMMRQGFYVLGVEPSICHVGGRCKEREMGTLTFLTTSGKPELSNKDKFPVTAQAVVKSARI